MDTKPHETKRLAIDLIRRDPSTQARAGLDEETVEQYREVYAELPRPKVCVDEEGLYWLWDGFATVEACQREGRKQIECDVWPGSHEDACWFAAGANVEHDVVGRRRTNADKRRAVEVALSCRRAAEKSNPEIADHCNVGTDLVSEIRAEIGTRLLGGATRENEKTRVAHPERVSSATVHAAIKKKPKKRPSAKPTKGTSRLTTAAEAEDLGHHDDPKWLHGTKAELRAMLEKRLTALWRAMGDVDKLLDRLGGRTGQAEKQLETIAKAYNILAAIVRGLG